MNIYKKTSNIVLELNGRSVIIKKLVKDAFTLMRYLKYRIFGLGSFLYVIKLVI